MTSGLRVGTSICCKIGFGVAKGQTSFLENRLLERRICCGVGSRLPGVDAILSGSVVDGARGVSVRAFVAELF